VVFYNVFQKKGADVEEQAAALGNVVSASMRAVRHPSPKAEAPIETAAERGGEHVARAVEVEA
jgi:hypothetical protein